MVVWYRRVPIGRRKNRMFSIILLLLLSHTHLPPASVVPEEFLAIEWFPLRPQLGHRLINDNRASDGFPLSPDRKLTETSSERERVKGKRTMPASRTRRAGTAGEGAKERDRRRPEIVRYFDAGRCSARVKETARDSFYPGLGA